MNLLLMHASAASVDNAVSREKLLPRVWSAHVAHLADISLDSKVNIRELWDGREKPPEHHRVTTLSLQVVHECWTSEVCVRVNLHLDTACYSLVLPLVVSGGKGCKALRNGND